MQVIKINFFSLQPECLNVQSGEKGQYAALSIASFSQHIQADSERE